jgi:hypothetical protein
LAPAVASESTMEPILPEHWKIGEDDVPICSHIVICWYNNMLLSVKFIPCFWDGAVKFICPKPSYPWDVKDFQFFYVLLEHMDRGPSTTVISKTLNVRDIQENPDSLLNVWCVYIYILLLFKLHAYLPFHSNPFRYTILHPKALYSTVFHYMMSLYIYLCVCMFAVNDCHWYDLLWNFP